MAPFPRTISPETVSPLTVPLALKQVSQAGNVQTRSTTKVGRTWTEEFTFLRVNDPDVVALLAFIEDAAHQGTEFTIKHLSSPGSGIAPNGTGTAGVTVNGGSQTGSSINTTGWPLSTSNVVRAGDLIFIAGTSVVRRITADANSDGSGNATISITPPIFTGQSPSNGASVTTTDVTFNAIIDEAPNLGNIESAFYIGNLSIKFREVPA